MLDNSTIPVAVEQDLKPSGFFDNRNRVIYETIINLFIKDNPIDHITLTNRLEKLGTLGVAGGYSYILEIPTFLPTPANIENYIEIVKNKAIQRQYIDIGTQIATVARSEENAEKIKNFAITKLLQINKQHEKGIETCTVEEIKPEDIRICEIFAHGVKIKSGAIWGIVGTTSTGKTELALDIVTAYQKQDTQNIALFCEYEGTKKEFLSRVSRKKIQGKIYYGIKPNYTDIIGFVMQHKDKKHFDYY